jgi:hypothetical protein
MLDDIGQDELTREALNTMLDSLPEPSKYIVIRNIQVNLQISLGIKSYFERSSPLVLDLS